MSQRREGFAQLNLHEESDENRKGKVDNIGESITSEYEEIRCVAPPGAHQCHIERVRLMPKITEITHTYT